MIEFLEHLDIQLLFFFNKTLSNPVFDVVMPFVTKEENLAPFLLIGIVLLAWKGGKRGRTLLLLLIPTIILTDQIASGIFKPLVSRMRPCRAFEALDTLNTLLGIKTSESFMSSHASNSFGAAMLIVQFYPRATWWAFGLAAVLAFSRIYTAVHYPFDVLAGALVGLLVGYWVYAVYGMLKNVRQRRTATAS